LFNLSEKLLRAQELRYALKSERVEMVSPKESHVAPDSSSADLAASKKQSSTNQNQKSIRRHTSAPAVNKSPARNRVNFDLGGSVSSRSRSGRLHGSSSRGLFGLEENSDTESAADDGRHLHRLVIDDPFLSSRSMPDLSRGNLDFRKVIMKNNWSNH